MNWWIIMVILVLHVLSWRTYKAGIQAVNQKLAKWYPCCAEMHTLLPTHSTKTAGRIAKPFQHHFLLLFQMLCQYNEGSDKNLMHTNPSGSTFISLKSRKYFMEIFNQKKINKDPEKVYSAEILPKICHWSDWLCYVTYWICKVSPFTLSSCLPAYRYWADVRQIHT